MGEKVSLEKENFDIITGLKYSSICEVQFEQNKPLQLYLGHITSMNGYELEKDYPILQFENDEDVVKISVYYFIELAMIGRKRRQHMD